MNIQLVIVVLGLGCSSSSDEPFSPGPDAAIEPLTCNDEGGFLEVGVTGAITADVDSDTEVSCGSIGGNGAPTRGVTLDPKLDDDRQWSFHVSGELELGAAVEGASVEVFVFVSDAGDSLSWSGNCVADVSTFEALPDDAPFDRYRLGAAITCDQPLQPFIGPDGPISINGFSFVGFHSD